ncbi:MAG: bifunctional diaminohydroxyphosphoribosylaminopyrimidine deaminase/5-amino-6-(5-phosphoribosylamino)uracil reductase RibD [Gammaproteobacteria bacterium]|nr:bifunctional diaminohydroxyphosphoribosylaminopyrimidine deaminase/5-amino-6-(5-phosphoribosylamino)uracil reductase RibD [Gammaproteobacteria bacterium]
MAETFTPLDARFMARALRLAERGRYTTSPNPQVGCVLAKGDAVVGEGWHVQAGGPHAEVNALAMAGEQARGATAYVTLEPCSHYGRTPPCAEALIKAGVSRVIAAMVDPNPLVAGRGLALLQQAGIVTAHGLMADTAAALNAGFISRMVRGRPRVTVKLGASLDGRTAMASGESQWITGAAARADVQRWRAASCAILSTAATVLADDPLLNLRWPAGEPYPLAQLRQPLRLIIDSQCRLQAGGRLLDEPAPIWLLRPADAPRANWFRPQDQQLACTTSANGQLNLPALLQQLGRLGLNELWVEAGATLAGALMQAGLADQLLIYLAPKLLGSDSRGLFALPGLEKLAASPNLQLVEQRMVGDDLRLVATVAPTQEHA